MPPHGVAMPLYNLALTASEIQSIVRTKLNLADLFNHHTETSSVIYVYSTTSEAGKFMSVAL